MLGQFSRAKSTIFFNSITFEPLYPPSAVTIRLQEASLILSSKDLAEKPAKTTECIAPILAHARVAIASSGVMGMYKQIRSLFEAPFLLSTFANAFTRLCNSLYVIFM